MEKGQASLSNIEENYQEEHYRYLKTECSRKKILEKGQAPLRNEEGARKGREKSKRYIFQYDRTFWQNEERRVLWMEVSLKGPPTVSFAYNFVTNLAQREREKERMSISIEDDWKKKCIQKWIIMNPKGRTSTVGRSWWDGRTRQYTETLPAAASPPPISSMSQLYVVLNAL